MNKPSISVILAVYNGSQFIKDAIQSMLDQSYADFEFIIVDDGSTDSTSEIVASFNDPRIKYEKREHAGLVPSLNYGLSIAEGKYVARMDADDYSLPSRFEKQVSLLEEHSEIVVCGSWAIIVDKENREIGTYSYPRVKSKEIRLYAIRGNPFIHPTTMYRREVILKAGGYRRFWKHTEDYELWTRIIYKHQVANIPEPLLNYRIHEGQITISRKAEMRFYGIMVRVLALFRFAFSKF